MTKQQFIITIQGLKASIKALPPDYSFEKFNDKGKRDPAYKDQAGLVYSRNEAQRPRPGSKSAAIVKIVLNKQDPNKAIEEGYSRALVDYALKTYLKTEVIDRDENREPVYNVRERIMEMYASGASTRDIAKELKMMEPVVLGIIHTEQEKRGDDYQENIIETNGNEHIA